MGRASRAGSEGQSRAEQREECHQTFNNNTSSAESREKTRTQQS